MVVVAERKPPFRAAWRPFSRGNADSIFCVRTLMESNVNISFSEVDHIKAVLLSLPFKKGQPIFGLINIPHGTQPDDRNAKADYPANIGNGTGKHKQGYTQYACG